MALKKILGLGCLVKRAPGLLNPNRACGIESLIMVPISFFSFHSPNYNNVKIKLLKELMFSFRTSNYNFVRLILEKKLLNCTDYNGRAFRNDVGIHVENS